MSHTRALKIGIVVTTALGCSAALLAASVLAAHLPDPIAVQWSPIGLPKANLPVAAALALVLMLALLPALLVWPWRPRPFLSSEPAALALVVFVNVQLAALVVVGSWLNWDKPRWDAPGDATYWLFPLLMVVGVVPAWLIAGLARRGWPAPVPEHATAAALLSRPGAFWFGSARAEFQLFICVVPVALQALLSGLWGMAAVHVVVLVLVEASSKVVLTIDPSGLTIYRGHLGVLRKRIELARVRSAMRIYVNERSDYQRFRWKHVLVGSAIISDGSGVRLDLASGESCTVSVLDAETATSLVNALLQERDRAAPSVNVKTSR